MHSDKGDRIPIVHAIGIKNIRKYWMCYLDSNIGQINPNFDLKNVYNCDLWLDRNQPRFSVTLNILWTCLKYSGRSSMLWRVRRFDITDFCLCVCLTK